MTTLIEVTAAQDAMNQQIEAAVQTFLDTCPGAILSYGNVTLTSVEGVLAPRASTQVEVTIDGARISRRMPEM